MRGKNKCKILKEIRRKIAEENDIPFITRECTFQGECRGTCPKCEAEVAMLERELEKRQRLGKKVAVVGLAAGLMASTVACDGGGVLQRLGISKVEELSGDMDIGEPRETVSSATPTPDILGGMEWDGDVEPEGESLPLPELDGDVAFPEGNYE